VLRGRFGDTSGRPYVEGRLSFPRLRIVGDISFILDTGADKSLLMPIDAERLGVDFKKLERTDESRGVGGLSRQFVEPAILAFTDGSFLHVYQIPMRIAVPNPEIMDIPSLLGRDVIDRWSVTYDKAGTGLTAEVRSADMRFEIDPKSPVADIAPDPDRT
jgi:hypothetical protein